MKKILYFIQQTFVYDSLFFWIFLIDHIFFFYIIVSTIDSDPDFLRDSPKIHVELNQDVSSVLCRTILNDAIDCFCGGALRKFQLAYLIKAREVTCISSETASRSRVCFFKRKRGSVEWFECREMFYRFLKWIKRQDI